MIKKHVFILLLIIVLFAIPAVSADDFNITDADSGVLGSESNYDESIATSIDSDFENNLSTTVIYFDASVSANGDGSKSKPYKFINQNTLNAYTSSGNGVIAYFADGSYDIKNTLKISSNVILIGESTEYTIFNSILTNKYDFEVTENSLLNLNNISFNHINIINRGTVEANNVNFYNSESFFGETAPLTFNTKNYGSYNGGVIICDPVGNSCPGVFLDNCTFESNIAYCGGAISLLNSRLSVSKSRFYNSYGYRLGGSIYAVNSDVKITDSDFEGNGGNYAGVMYCENSAVDLKNLKCYNSAAGSFGGVMAFKYSNVTMDACDIQNYRSYTDGGGAIYNFKGNLDISNSYFINGDATFGAAICNLDSYLAVRSSFFQFNYGTSGGAIYNMYGEMHIENNQFVFSSAYFGGAICGEISDLVFIYNNTFVNSFTKQDDAAISLELSKGLFEDGNNFEDVFHVSVEFSAYLDGKV